MNIENIIATTGYISAIIQNTVLASGSSNTSINLVNLINNTSSGIAEFTTNNIVTLSVNPNPIANIYRN